MANPFDALMNLDIGGIDKSFPVQGQAKPAHEGSQSTSPPREADPSGGNISGGVDHSKDPWNKSFTSSQ